MEHFNSESILRGITQFGIYGFAIGCVIGIPILAYKATSIVHELCCLAHDAMEHNYGITYDNRFGFHIGQHAFMPEGTPKSPTK